MTKKMTEDKKEYDLKMQEYAELLDIRGDRIRVSKIIIFTTFTSHGRGSFRQVYSGVIQRRQAVFSCQGRCLSLQ